MTLFHVTLRRSVDLHAIKHLLVELSVRTSFPMQAADVIANVEKRWLGWQAVGIERSL